MVPKILSRRHSLTASVNAPAFEKCEAAGDIHLVREGFDERPAPIHNRHEEDPWLPVVSPRLYLLQGNGNTVRGCP